MLVSTVIIPRLTTNTTQTIPGDKTYTGKVDLSGANLTIPPAAVKASNIDFATGIWWEELARVSNSGQTSINSGMFAARIFLKFFLKFNPSQLQVINMRFNRDNGNNYNSKPFNDFVAGTVDSSASSISLFGGATNQDNHFIEMTLRNEAGAAKPFIMVGTSSTGINRVNNGNWNNTSAQITSVNFSASTGNLGAAEIIVLGHN